MKSFYEFYQKILKENAMMQNSNDMQQQSQQQSPPTPDVQGGQTSPAIGNPLDDPEVKKALETLKNVSDDSFKNAFNKFSKEIGANADNSSDQNQTDQSNQFQNQPDQSNQDQNQQFSQQQAQG